MKNSEDATFALFNQEILLEEDQDDKYKSQRRRKPNKTIFCQKQRFKSYIRKDFISNEFKIFSQGFR